MSALILMVCHLFGVARASRESKIQTAHLDGVPRIGGLAVFVSFGAFCFLLIEEDERLIAKQIILGGVGVFLAGMAEDFTERVSPMMRLLVSIGCSLWLVLFSGISIKGMGVGGWEEALLGYWPAGVFVTALCVAGMTNALNLVDGLNGLASGIASAALIAIGLVALAHGDLALAAICWCLLAVTLGFLVWNWPLGRLFLGDGGAYFLGMSLAWLAVLLPARNPSISPWVSFLVIAYPAIDMLHTVWRRIRSQQHLASPDTLHLHSLIFERLSGWNIALKSVLVRNSIAGFFAVMIASIAPIIAVAFHDNERLLITASLAYAAAYSVVYRWLAGPRWLEISPYRPSSPYLTNAIPVIQLSQILRRAPYGYLNSS
jgi:UDP-N-acetylmuramyl pentapeptide phosphotransferase/UDP-N-acetylglucosamine-1-phosphate transferase